MSRPAIIADPDWVEHAVNTIERLALAQPEVTSEDLRRAMEPPEHANQIGGAFQSAHAQKIITPIGYRPSRDKSRRGGAVRVWTLNQKRKK